VTCGEKTYLVIGKMQRETVADLLLIADRNALARLPSRSSAAKVRVKMYDTNVKAGNCPNAATRRII